MGGERFYEGTIFVANVIGMDVGQAENSLPWDPVASFKLNGLAETEISVSAYLPRRMLMISSRFSIPTMSMLLL